MPPPTSLTESAIVPVWPRWLLPCVAMRPAYKLERRLELALEGQRWYDLCRWDEVESVMNNINDEGRAANVKAYNTNSYLMPLPQTVLDSNENLVQNPGY